MNETLLDAQLLIVDDDQINCEVLDSRLRFAGFSQVRVAHSGQEALEILANEMPDLMLLDVLLPDLNGFQITRRVREDYPGRNIPIILVSALIEPQDRAHGIEVGANDFISRPFDGNELVARVKSALTHKYTLDQLESERARVSILYRISQAFTLLDYEKMINTIVSLTTELTGAAKAILVPIDEQGNFHEKFVSRSGESASSASQIDQQAFTLGLLGWIVKHAQPALINDVNKDKRWVELEDDTDTAGSVIGVPLMRADHVVGALLVVSPETNAFNAEQLELLTAIGSHAALALENARLFDQARRERARAEALLHQIGTPVIVTDPQGNIARSNPSADQVFELDSSSIGRPLSKVFNLSLADLLLRAHERNQTVSGEFSPRKKAGEAQRDYNVSISPIESVGYMLVWQDITGIKESERVRLDSERAETQRIRDAFSRYMSSTLMDRVLDDKDILDRRERREAIVLFADLRGFTRLTIEHPPDAVVSLINDHFNEMMDIIDRFEGLVFDITGDELMAAFNVPYDQTDLNQRALGTAIAMQRRFAQLKKRWAKVGMDVGLGIGINRGPVVLGHIGGKAQMTYSMIGQTVNIGHRLVEIAEDAQIIVTPEMMSDGLSDSAGIVIEDLAPRSLKGQQKLQQMTLLRVGRQPRASKAKS